MIKTQLRRQVSVKFLILSARDAAKFSIQVYGYKSNSDLCKGLITKSYAYEVTGESLLRVLYYVMCIVYKGHVKM